MAPNPRTKMKSPRTPEPAAAGEGTRSCFCSCCCFSCGLPKARCGGFPVTYNLHSSFVSSVVKRLHLYLISAAHNQSCKLLNQRGLAKSDSNSTATRHQLIDSHPSRCD